MNKPVYEIDLEIGNMKVTLLTLEKPKEWYWNQWNESDVEPIGYLVEAEDE